MAIRPREDTNDPPSATAGEAPRGVVSAVAGMDRAREADGRHAGIVDRVFGPRAAGNGSSTEASGAARPADESEALNSSQPRYAEIDVEFSLGEVARKRASVLGAATKVAGELVADENVEVEGLVEGAVRVRRARVTVGREGLVLSRIDARSVRVRGTVRGDVCAADWVEVKPGGVIRGDVRAPRIILHDGAIVTGRLDMSRAIEARRAADRLDPLVVQKRPAMRKVESKRRRRGA